MNINVTSTDESAHFTLSNAGGLDTSIINSIRRAIITEIPVVGFDTETDHNVNMVKNNTVLHNEYLEHRIGLIPLSINPETYKYLDILFVINLKVTDTDILEVTSNNFDIYKKKEGLEIIFNLEDLNLEEFRQIYNREPLNQEEKDTILKPFNHEGINHYITITKLKRENISGDGTEELLLFASPSVNIGKTNARFSHVSQCTYSFTQDDAKVSVEKKHLAPEKHQEFDNLDIQRFYKTDSLDRPNSYDFKLESMGYLSNNQCFIKGIDILVSKFKYFKETKLPSLRVEPCNDFKNAIQIVIPEEDDTLGNPIQKYMHYNFIETTNPSVKYCCYVRPHPLKDEIVIKLITDNDPKEAIVDTCDIIIKILGEIKRTTKGKF